MASHVPPSPVPPSASESKLVSDAWTDTFAALYVVRERCSSERAHHVADLLYATLGSMNALDAVEFLIGSPQIRAAMWSKFDSGP